MPTRPIETNVYLAIPSSIIAEMEEIALAEGKTLDEIAQDAVQQFLEDRRWRQLITYGKEQARKHGLKSTDVQRLIAESRREQ